MVAAASARHASPEIAVHLTTRSQLRRHHPPGGWAVRVKGFMSLRFCNSDTRARVLAAESSPACVWFATRGVSGQPRSFQHALQDLLDRADPGREPTGTEVGLARVVEVAVAPYI